MTEAKTLLQTLAGGASRPPVKCKLGRIVDRVDIETRGALTNALAGKDWSSCRIARLISQHIEPIGRSTVDNHRLGVCGCHR